MAKEKCTRLRQASGKLPGRQSHMLRIFSPLQYQAFSRAGALSFLAATLFWNQEAVCSPAPPALLRSNTHRQGEAVLPRAASPGDNGPALQNQL
jgi:hypothetical protein